MVGWFICVIIERDFLDIFFFLILCFCFVLFHSKLEFPIDMCSTIFVCLGCFLTSSHLPLDSFFSRNCIYWMFYLFSIAFPLYIFLNFNNNKNLPVLFRFSFISFLEFQQQQKLTYSLLSSFWPSVSWLLFSPPLQKNSEKKFCLLKISVCLLMFNAC